MSNRILTSHLLAGLCAAAFATVGAAQNCSDNTYPVHIVDADGNELPTTFDPAIGEEVFLVPTETVYLAFDPNLPSGTYYVHITDTPINGLDEVVSTNDPMDRFVQVDNQGGVITLSFPMSSDPGAIQTGIGLGGVGQSLCLDQFQPSQFSQCSFKLWYGNNWDLTNGPNNPYLLAGQLMPGTTECAVRSYHSFRVGDGDGGDVCGVVFEDTNENGQRDSGEPGLPGWTVNLVDGQNSISVVTDNDGNYCFENVASGSFTVELALQSGFQATTSTANPIETCACATKQGGDFGVTVENVVACDARTIGFWRNRHGSALVQQHNLLPLLTNLCIVNRCGHQVSFANVRQYRRWLRRANSWNMAYMLSAQLVAMHNNVAVGFVSSNAVVDDPVLGQITIADLMQQAVLSLCAHPYTPPCSGPARYQQAVLKNALDRANHNETWMNCNSTHTGGGGSSGHGHHGRRRHHRRNGWWSWWGGHGW